MLFIVCTHDCPYEMCRLYRVWDSNNCQLKWCNKNSAKFYMRSARPSSVCHVMKGFGIAKAMTLTRPDVPGLTLMRPPNSHTIQVQNEKIISIFFHKPTSFHPSLSPPPSISLCSAVKQGSLSTRAEMSVQSPTAQRGDSAPASPRGVMSRQATSCSISMVLKME